MVEGNIQRELGAMANEMKNLAEGLHAMRAAQLATDKKMDERAVSADEGRRRLHERLEQTERELSTQLNRVEDDVLVLKKDLQAVSNMAKDAREIAGKVTAWEQRGKGILIALGVGGTFAGAALSAWVETVWAYVKSRVGF